MRMGIIERSGDAGGYGGRIRDEVARQRPGVQFAAQPAQADVVLLIVGPRWARAGTDEPSRLLDPSDPVRRTVEAALATRCKLVPILVSGAAFPTAGDLPPTLRPLLHTNGWPVSHQGFRSDVKALVEGLDRPDRAELATQGSIVLRGRAGGPIRRYFETDYSAARILLDGEIRGAMALVGDVQTYEVAPGEHEVVVETSSGPPRFRCSKRVCVPSGGKVELEASRNWLVGTIDLQVVR